MKLCVDGGKRTVPPVCAWAVIDYHDSGQVWSGILPSDYTSNQAEYHAVLNALRVATYLEYTGVLVIQSDSQLIVRQVNGEYKCRDRKLQPLLQEVKLLIKNFEDVALVSVPREENEEADLAVNVAMDNYLGMKRIINNE